MRKIYNATVMLFFSIATVAQSKTDAVLTEILNKTKNNLARSVFSQPDSFRLQIIYTQINRDAKNRPSFKNYYFNYNADNYYNPASMVKMPLAFLSLEKLHGLQKAGINKFTRMQFDSSYSGQKIMIADSTAENKFPSIAQFIKRAFLISENDPYNRMYQFVGQEAINKTLHEKGYDRLRITRQFMGFNEEQNRHTNPINFLTADGKIMLEQEPAYNKMPFDFSKKFLLGIGYLDKNDSLIHQPFDFTKHNYIPLEDFQQILQSVVFPLSVPQYRRFDLSKEDRAFLLKFLSQYPSETDFPKYDEAIYYNSYVKYFFRDSTHIMPDHIRVFNKVGWAYGFLTDVSYVVDFKNKVEFMLSATIYTNQDGILNDDKYEYETIGLPVLHEIGQLVLHYEQERKRTFKPDLNAFKINYDKRNPANLRASIKAVDN